MNEREIENDEYYRQNNLSPKCLCPKSSGLATMSLLSKIEHVDPNEVLSFQRTHFRVWKHTNSNTASPYK